VPSALVCLDVYALGSSLLLGDTGALAACYNLHLADRVPPGGGLEAQLEAAWWHSGEQDVLGCHHLVPTRRDVAVLVQPYMQLCCMCAR
jgi:hypothetical protein